MRVLISGASGLLGRALVSHLRADGCDVRRLVRRASQAPDEFTWDPAAGQLDPSALEGVDVVVNLSGAGLADHRWTDHYRRVLRASRVDSTRTITQAVAEADPKPRVLLNASAIGWYGDTGEHAVTEEAGPGSGFLAELCREWEAAAEPADRAGLRVVFLRTGLVLTRQGGLLGPLLPLFRWGLGGRLGSGRQYMSWISLHDWLGAVRFLMSHDVAGPVNLTAPYPVTNAEFTKALAQQLHRPVLFWVPGFALRIVMGEFGTESLASQRVLPDVLTRAGYRFTHSELPAALQWALTS